MPKYRIYFVGQDDHFHGAENIDCDTDDAAHGNALERIESFPAVEVWCDARPVGRIGLDCDSWPD